MFTMYLKFEISCFIAQFCLVLSIGNIYFPKVGEDSLEKCLITLLSSKSQFGSDVAVINNDLLKNDLIKKIHDPKNVRLYVKDYNVSVSLSPNIIIIHLNDLFDFEILIDGLDRDWYRKPDALHIILIRGLYEDNFVTIFKILWEYHIVHTLVIVDEMNGNASVYSYFPYAEGRCGHEYNNTIKICECLHHNHGEIDVIELLRKFDKPVLKNCTLQIATHNFPPLVIMQPDPINEYAVGIERYLLEMLLESENIFWNYTYSPETRDFGHVSDNFSVSGVLETLYENEVDLVFGGFSLTRSRGLFFDFICTHLAFHDKYVGITRSAGFTERWKIVYIMFDFKIWLFLLFILILCAVVFTKVGKYKINVNNMFILECFNLFGSATLNVTLNLRNSISQNVIIIHWLWLIFFINCFYQTRLTSYSTYRSYKPQINSFMALNSRNLTPCLTDTVISFLHDSKFPIANEKYLGKDGCDSSDKILGKIADSSNKYTIMMYFRYLWWVTKHSKEKDRVHLMEQNIFNTLNAIFFKRGFPLLQRFTRKMLNLVENGFLQTSKDFHIVKLHSSTSKIKGSLQICLLKLEDLIIPFCLLCAGLSIAIFVFIIEVIHRNNNQISAA